MHLVGALAPPRPGSRAPPTGERTRTDAIERRDEGDRGMTPRSGGHAVVMGAGMAGLLAARVLAGRFDRVTVLDRDRLPTGPVHRAGIPQGRHLHTLLPGGLELAEGWFPGLGDELAAAGAHPMRFGRDVVVHRSEGPSYLATVSRRDPLDTGLGYLALSRALLEHVVRNRVRALPGIELHDRAEVHGPRMEHDAVRGVVLEHGERVAADLVVDAAGRAGRSLGWLAALGYRPPAESVVHCDFAYASAILRPDDPDALDGGMLVVPDPAGAAPTRGGYVTRIEGDLWLAGLAGRSGDHPPVDTAGWRAFGRTLPSRTWDDLVGTATLLEGPVLFRFPRSVRRHVERLDRFPDGLLPLGDSLCHTNPLFGHGMSSAAGQARVLEQVLDDRARRGGETAGMAGEYFAGVAEVVRGPWALAAGSDFLATGTTGDFPVEEAENLMRLVQLGSMVDHDAHAASLFVDLSTLRRPWSTLEESPWRERLSPQMTDAAP